MLVCVGTLLWAVMLSVRACEATTAPDPPRRFMASMSADSTLRLAPPVNRFGADLLSAMYAADSQKNLALCPPALMVALGTAWMGSANETRDALGRVLRLHGLDGTAAVPAFQRLAREMAGLPGCSWGASLWVMDGIPLDPAFAAQARAISKTTCGQVDFSEPTIAKSINAWAKRTSAGTVVRVVDATRANTSILMACAASISAPFDTVMTPVVDGVFCSSDGTQRKIRFLEGHIRCRHIKDSRFELAGIPCRGGRLALYVIMPRTSTSLVQLLHDAAGGNLDRWILASQTEQGVVRLPAFEASSSGSLLSAIRSLGANPATDERAEFPGISKVTRLRIDAIAHGALIDVGGEGIGSSLPPATARRPEVGPGGPPTAQFDLTADGPFLWALRDDAAGVTLFLGIVEEPAVSPAGR